MNKVLLSLACFVFLVVLSGSVGAQTLSTTTSSTQIDVSTSDWRLIWDDPQNNGGIRYWYDLVNDPTEAENLVSTAAGGVGLFTYGYYFGGNTYHTHVDESALEFTLLESSDTRAVIKARGRPAVSPGQGGQADTNVEFTEIYTVYASGKIGIKFDSDWSTAETLSVGDRGSEQFWLHLDGGSWTPQTEEDSSLSSGDDSSYNGNAKTDSFILFYSNGGRFADAMLSFYGNWNDADVIRYEDYSGSDMKHLFWKDIHEHAHSGTQPTRYFMIQLGTSGSTILPDLNSNTDADPYSEDYQNPDSLTFMIGSQVGDGFDEGELAYTMSASSSRVKFNLTGTAYMRYKPVFKITNYTDYSEPIVKLNGITLTDGIDYNLYLNTATDTIIIQYLEDIDYEVEFYIGDISPYISPTITIASPQNKTYATTSIDLNVSANEDINTWWYNLNSGSNTTFTPNTTITGEEGLNNLVVYANDTAGNMNSSTVWFTIDTPPTITIDSPTNTTYATPSIDLNVSANEPIDTWMYSLDGGNNVTFSPNITLEENWWDSSWEYRQVINITNNNDSAVLEGEYTVNITFDHSSLVSAGKSLANGNDVRVIWQPNASYSLELDRVNSTDFNAGSSLIWFKLQEDVNAGESDLNYYLYYGNPSAAAPPADGNNVYLFYDDFEYTDSPTNHGWLVSQSGSGVVRTSTSQKYTGSRSLECYQTTDVGDTYCYKDFGANQFKNMVFEIMFYDFETEETSSYDGHQVALSYVIPDPQDLKFGPSGPSGNYICTGAPRAVGWHYLKFIANYNGTRSIYYHTDPNNNVYSCSVPTTSYRYIGFWSIWRGTSGFYHDDAKVRKYLSPEPTTSIGEEETRLLSEGTHKLTVYANDTAGNLETSNVWFTIAPATVNISLIPEWNMISIPLDQYNWSIDSVLSSLEGNYTVAFAYMNGTWHKSTSRRFPFTNMGLKYGYWINMTEYDTLEISGLIPSSTTIDVIPEWNLVGYPTLESRNLTEVLSPINYTVVFTYMNGTWQKSTSRRFPMTNMTPGYGYWINATDYGSYEVIN